MDILSYEIALFKTDMRFPDTLSYKRSEDYYYGMRKAFDDAFNQYARRSKLSYASNKDELIKPILECIFNYLNSNDKCFNQCFFDCIQKSMQIMNNQRFGLAQKFVNMSFKYMMCFSDSKEISNKFKDCHLPLDKYTINWVRSFGNKEINKKLNTIKNAWANIDEDLYNTIQNFAKEQLSNNIQYTISFSNSTQNKTCTLPAERLSAEFIIWHQEKINELHKILEKSKSDFERLGIKQI